MVVERDDAMFGSGTDVARLEIASADRFHLDIAPPALADDSHVGEEYCVETLHGRLCGSRDHYHENIVLGAKGVRNGDSGSPVFNDAGRLVGLEVSSGKMTDGTVFFRYVTITPYWLEGT